MTYPEKIQKITEVINDDSLDEMQKVGLIKRIANKSARHKIPYPPPKSTMKEIEDQIVDYFGFSMDEINKAKRKEEIVKARQFAHYKAKKFTNESLFDIGWHFGRKDHATVLHSHKTILNYLEVDKRFRAEHEEFLNN